MSMNRIRKILNDVRTKFDTNVGQTAPIYIYPPNIVPKFPRFCGTIYFSFDAEDKKAAFAYLHGVAAQLNTKGADGVHGDAGVCSVEIVTEDGEVIDVDQEG